MTVRIGRNFNRTSKKGWKKDHDKCHKTYEDLDKSAIVYIFCADNVSTQLDTQPKKEKSFTTYMLPHSLVTPTTNLI